MDKLDAKCQLVEAKIDLNEITTFLGVFKNGDQIIQVFQEYSLLGYVNIFEERSKKQITQDTNVQGRFSLYGMWIEYKGLMANSYTGACNLV